MLIRTKLKPFFRPRQILFGMHFATPKGFWLFGTFCLSFHCFGGMAWETDRFSCSYHHKSTKWQIEEVSCHEIFSEKLNNPRPPNSFITLKISRDLGAPLTIVLTDCCCGIFYRMKERRFRIFTNFIVIKIDKMALRKPCYYRVWGNFSCYHRIC